MFHGMCGVVCFALFHYFRMIRHDFLIFQEVESAKQVEMMRKWNEGFKFELGHSAMQPRFLIFTRKVKIPLSSGFYSAVTVSNHSLNVCLQQSWGGNQRQSDVVAMLAVAFGRARHQNRSGCWELLWGPMKLWISERSQPGSHTHIQHAKICWFVQFLFMRTWEWDVFCFCDNKITT